MFGKVKKDPQRVKRLVNNVRSSGVNLNGVTEDFLKYYSLIGDKLAGAVAESSGNQYYLSFNRFAAFCVENNVPSLPSDPDIIMTYFIKVSQENKGAAAALMARSAIRYYNLLYRPDCVSPTDRSDVGMMMKCIRREFSKPVHKVEDMTKVILKKLIDEGLRGDQIRDTDFKESIITWMIVTKTVLKFYTFARFEEAVELKKSSFILLDSGDLEVTFLKAKNNQFHDVGKVIIAASEKECDPFCPVKVICTYFKRISSDLDHYFMPKFKAGSCFLLEKTAYQFCLDNYRRALRSIGVDNWKDFGEHSDRIGGLSAAANAGCALEDLQVHGRWRSDAMPKIYHKKSLQKKKKVTQVLNAL